MSNFAKMSEVGSEFHEDIEIKRQNLKFELRIDKFI